MKQDVKMENTGMLSVHLKSARTVWVSFTRKCAFLHFLHENGHLHLSCLSLRFRSDIGVGSIAFSLSITKSEDKA